MKRSSSWKNGDEGNSEVVEIEKPQTGKQDDGIKEQQPLKAISSSRPVWVRSLSQAGRQRRRDPVRKLELQDSKSGAQAEGQGGGRGMERKRSLTGEEVKDLADAYIARVRQRMRAQRQESLRLRPATPTVYQPPPLP